MPRLRGIGHDLQALCLGPGIRHRPVPLSQCCSLEASRTDADEALMLHSGSGESLSLRTQGIETRSGERAWFAAGLLFSELRPDGNRVDPRNLWNSFHDVSLHCSDNERAEPGVRHGLPVRDTCLSSQCPGSGYVPPTFSVLLPPPRA